MSTEIKKKKPQSLYLRGHETIYIQLLPKLVLPFCLQQSMYENHFTFYELQHNILKVG